MMVEHFGLSDRELEVLQLLANGVGNKEIASRLGISTNTVKVHLRKIYAKLDVNSRTEAVMLAIRSDLVSVDGIVSENYLPHSTKNSDRGFTQSIPSGPFGRSMMWYLTLVLVGVLLVSVIGMLILVRQGPGGFGKPAALEPENQRWTALPTLPTARRGLAVTAFENQIYAIGGETETEIRGDVERYDPQHNSWEQLAPKPIAVTDIQAVVIGGLIYVPGGRLADGEITQTLEVFDPKIERWRQLAPLPVALSAYAAVAFEGQLYTFGGWDGENYVKTVLSYDPQRNSWSEQTAMEFPAGLASAEVAGGTIIVMGGVNNTGILDMNYVYYPQNELSDDPAWQSRSPMPEGRYAFGMVGVADIIHVLGGVGTEGNPAPYKYFPYEDQWQMFTPPDARSRSHFDGAVIETHLYFLGGEINNKISDESQSYQAIYTLTLPIVK